MPQPSHSRFLPPNPVSAQRTPPGRQYGTMAPTWPRSEARLEKAPALCFSSTQPARTSSRPSLTMRTTANRSWSSTARSQGSQLATVSSGSHLPSCAAVPAGSRGLAQVHEDSWPERPCRGREVTEMLSLGAKSEVSMRGSSLKAVNHLWSLCPDLSGQPIHESLLPRPLECSVLNHREGCPHPRNV